MKKQKTPTGKKTARGKANAPAARKRIEYSASLAEQILDQIIDGKTLKEIEVMPGMPSRTMVFKWRKKHEEFAALYDAASDLRADGIADDVEDIWRLMREGKIDPNAGREIFNMMKWAAGVRAPRRYGPKERGEFNVNTEHSNHLHLSVQDTSESIRKLLGAGEELPLKKLVSE